MQKIAIILSGCGVYDGAEIHEATLTLLALSKRGIEYKIFAPDITQHHVINHITGEEMPETRNVLIEAARIARGNISELSLLDMKQFDALIIPGGFGVAKNFSDLAFKGAEMSVIEPFKKVIINALENKKPIGALCITPAVISKIVNNARLTIGTDKGTASVINSLNCEHIATGKPGEIVEDKILKIVSTACYMENYSIAEVNEGIENLVDKVVELI